VRGELAALRRPEILTPVSLIGENSRGGERASGSVAAGESLLVSVDVPTADQYADYSADLEDPSGARVLSVPVSAAQARDTVTIRVPGRRWERGDYTLVVRGRPRRATAGALAADASAADASAAGASSAGTSSAGTSSAGTSSAGASSAGASAAGDAGGGPAVLARYRFTLNGRTAP